MAQGAAEFTLTIKVRAEITPKQYEAVGLALLRHIESLAWAIHGAPELRGSRPEINVQPLTVKSAP